jgi:hypothetical protein
MDALKWKFTGRDHSHLSKLGSQEDEVSELASPLISELRGLSVQSEKREVAPNFFQMLHRGNIRINKAWGQKITYDLSAIDDQPIQ